MMKRTKPQKIKSGLGGDVGNSGEYFLLVELLRRSYVANLTARGTRGFDVIAVSPKGRGLKFRVKTKEAATSWVWKARGGKEEAGKVDAPIFSELKSDDPSDFTALVDVPENVDVPVRLVTFVRTLDLDAFLRDRYRMWLHTRAKKSGDPHNPHGQRRLNIGEELKALLAKHRVEWKDLETDRTVKD